MLYVWFEAVIGYLSAPIEWSQLSGNKEAWRDWWINPAAKQFHFIGKDNIFFHTSQWPAELMGAGSAVLLGHGGIFELPVNPNRPVFVDPQAFVASAGQVSSTLKSAMSWRNVGRGGGESMQLECTGQGVVYVQASEQKL